MWRRVIGRGQKWWVRNLVMEEVNSAKTQKYLSSHTQQKSLPWMLYDIINIVIYVLLLFSHQVVLRSQGLQSTKLPSLSPSPVVCSDSCQLSCWRYLTILSSATLYFFCLQSFPASESFPIVTYAYIICYYNMWHMLHIKFYWLSGSARSISWDNFLDAGGSISKMVYFSSDSFDWLMTRRSAKDEGWEFVSSPHGFLHVS